MTVFLCSLYLLLRILTLSRECTISVTPSPSLNQKYFFIFLKRNFEILLKNLITLFYTNNNSILGLIISQKGINKMIVYETNQSDSHSLKKMHRILSECRQNNISAVGVTIDELNSSNYQKWLCLAKEYQIDIVPFLKVAAYSEIHQTICEYLFVVSNSIQKSIVKNVNHHMSKQSIPIITKSAISFFERLNYPLLKVSGKRLLDACSDTYTNLNFFNIHTETPLLLSDSASSWNSWLENITISQRLHKQPTINYSNKFSLSHLVSSFTYRNKEEKKIINEELQSLRENNQESIFLLAHLLKDSGIIFAGDFNNYLISQKLGLTDHVNMQGRKERCNDFVFLANHIERFLGISAMKNFLKKYSCDIKHSIIQKKPLFADLFSHFLDKNNTSAIDTHKVIEWTEVKDKYDDFKGTKQEFFEEMKFLFLFQPTEFLSFQKSLAAIEGESFVERNDYSISSIIPLNTFETHGETVKKTREELTNLKIPYIIWTEKK